MTDPPIQQHGDRVTIATAPMLAAAYRAALAGIARRRRDGLPAGDLQALRTALYRAHAEAVSASGRRLDDSTPDRSSCECQDGATLVGVTEAAALLSVSPRQVRRLLAAGNAVLGGQRIGNAWALDLGAVLALARQREAAI